MIITAPMRALGSALLLVTAAAGAVLLTGAPAASAQGRVLGGYRDIATDDAGVQAAAAFAAGEVGGSLQSVDSAQIQSVAGANYRLTITLEDGAVWQVVVYRNLQGGHSLTSSTQTSEGETDTGTNDGSDHSGDDNRTGTRETGA
jgi:hypothetical protein